jgi:hypothetical protein
MPARKLARNPQRGFGLYTGLAVRHKRKGIRAIRIDAELLSERTSLGQLDRNEARICLNSDIELTSVDYIWTLQEGRRSRRAARKWRASHGGRRTPFRSITFKSPHDRQAVVDRLHAGSQPGRDFDGFAFVPTTDSAFKRYLVPLPNGNADRLSLHLRMSRQCILDLLLDIGHSGRRLDRDAVCYAGDPGELSNGILEAFR